MKRKADTTTPVVATMPKDPALEPTVKIEKVVPSKIPTTRRESNRPIKKPKRDLLEEDSPDPVSVVFHLASFCLETNGHWPKAK